MKFIFHLDPNFEMNSDYSFPLVSTPARQMDATIRLFSTNGRKTKSTSFCTPSRVKVDLILHFHSMCTVRMDAEFHLYSIYGVQVDATVCFHSICELRLDAGIHLKFAAG